MKICNSILNLIQHTQFYFHFCDESTSVVFKPNASTIAPIFDGLIRIPRMSQARTESHVVINATKSIASLFSVTAVGCLVLVLLKTAPQPIQIPTDLNRVQGRIVQLAPGESKGRHQFWLRTPLGRLDFVPRSQPTFKIQLQTEQGTSQWLEADLRLESQFDKLIDNPETVVFYTKENHVYQVETANRFQIDYRKVRAKNKRKLHLASLFIFALALKFAFLAIKEILPNIKHCNGEL